MSCKLQIQTFIVCTHDNYPKVFIFLTGYKLPITGEQGRQAGIRLFFIYSTFYGQPGAEKNFFRLPVLRKELIQIRDILFLPFHHFHFSTNK